MMSRANADTYYETARVNLLIARLNGARRHKNGWVARCPAHEDRSPSLTVTVAGDGKILLHCFAECPALHVVQAIGLTLADLFPERLSPTTTAGRLAARHSAKEASWTAALAVTDFEAGVIISAANQLLDGNSLLIDDIDRLKLAVRRISSARAMMR